MPTEPDYVAHLRALVDRAAPMLMALPDDAASARPAPGKWSVKEIVGHLVDSASHNHQRFVRARWQEDLVFAGYEQDDWVAAQAYASAPWPELVILWQAYNHHIGRVMAGVPDEVRMRIHSRHNLDTIAWRTVPATETTTLDYLMRDYVGHLEHHLRQIERVAGRG